MNRQPTRPPYFDGLFRRLADQDPETVAAFGRHVHWGYWPIPPEDVCSPEEYGAAAERLSQELIDTAGIQDGMRILDVGCGFGGTIASLNERFRDLTLVGVNLDGQQLERAAKVVRPRLGNSISFVQSDAADMPLTNADFDVVLAVECVFHFDRPRFFGEVERLLRPGGNLVLSDFVPSARVLEFTGEWNLSSDDAVQWSYGHIDLSYSLQRYRKLAEAHQLRLTRHIDITAHTLPTYAYLYESTAMWPDAEEVAHFASATRRLEKASRKGLIGYLILRFDRV